MIDNLAQALAWIDEDEGPELNVDGSEPGGSSKHGVSMTVLREWHASHRLPPPTMDDMRAVDSALAGAIYSATFAVPLRFRDLPSGADYRLLDIGVNLGVRGGATALQLALGRWPADGQMTDALVAAASAMSAEVLVHTLSGVWLGRKWGSLGWGRYGRGWAARSERATGRALQLLAATTPPR